jgi:hypothetical protein
MQPNNKIKLLPKRNTWKIYQFRKKSKPKYDLKNWSLGGKGKSSFIE